MTSEIYEKIKEIKDQISQIEKEKYILDIKNPNQTDLKIKNLRNILSSIEKDMNEVLIIYEGLQKQEQLEVINEIKQLESEYKLQKKNIDEIDEKNTQKLNWYKARNNEISGYEAEKIIRKEYEIKEQQTLNNTHENKPQNILNNNVNNINKITAIPTIIGTFTPNSFNGNRGKFDLPMQYYIGFYPVDGKYYFILII